MDPVLSLNHIHQQHKLLLNDQNKMATNDLQGREGEEEEREREREEESEGREEEKERVMGRGGERFRLLINITYQLVPRPVCLLAVLNCISYKPNEFLTISII